MGYTSIEFSISDGIAVIRLNRPSEGNALTREMAQEILHAATACDESKEVRVVILTGNGKMFCAGGDLKAFASQGQDVGRYIKETTHALHGAISRFSWMNAPVIGAINGTAAGGGFSLSLAPDVALAAESARFTMAYTKAGLSPDGSSTYFLARLVGLRRAKEMALLNPILSAKQALDWGIVNQVLPEADLFPKAMELARTIAQGSLEAFGETKRMILSGVTESLESQMDVEARTIARIAGTRNGLEGVQAFIEKRPPRFSGNEGR